MLTEVMRFYGLARPPVDAGFFETEHHAQVSRDIRAAIMGGRLIALTAIIGSGKTVLSRRLRADLEREGRVTVSRSLSIDKAKISLPLLEAALFYDLTPEKTVKISSQSERRERDLQELFRRAKKPVALFIDDAHDLHPKTLTALKRLIELVAEGGGQLSIVLVGPAERNAIAREFLQRCSVRRNRLRQMRCRLPVLFTESQKRVAESFLCGGPLKRRPIAREFFQRCSISLKSWQNPQKADRPLGIANHVTEVGQNDYADHLRARLQGTNEANNRCCSQ